MNVTHITSGFKKEIWEFNKTLFWVPIVIAGMLILSPIVQMLLLEDYQVDGMLDGLSRLDGVENVSFAIQGVMSAVFVPFLMIALVIQLYYFTSCLYDERRDLSVYFWRSLPVSDVQALATKFATGAFVIPGIFMLAATGVVIAALVFLLIACFVLAGVYDISLWGVWGSIDLFSNIGSMWLSLIPYGLWLFPFFAWLMLASMFASKAPFLWATLPVAAVLLVEAFMVAYFRLDNAFFAELLMEYFRFTQEVIPRDAFKGDSSKLIVFSALGSKIGVGATLVGCVFMYATYWLRVNRAQA
jgi:ABC-2 type transport system permease protein